MLDQKSEPDFFMFYVPSSVAVELFLLHDPDFTLGISKQKCPWNVLINLIHFILI